MTSNTPELVHRLYRRLVEAARERGDNGLPELTVGNVYQQLVPYRAVRSELGVFELAEYENALLRLLAGEGDYLRIADEGARAELAAELDSPNPILGIYRDYASLPVELLRPVDHARPVQAPDPDQFTAVDRFETGFDDVRDVADYVAEEPTTDMGDAEWDMEDEQRGQDEGVAPEPLPELPYTPPRPLPADATRVARPAPPHTPARTRLATGATNCVACGLSLPDVEGLRFCPHCGADQTAVPCERCGAPIRDEWNFCIRCGARRPAEGAAR